MGFNKQFRYDAVAILSDYHTYEDLPVNGRSYIEVISESVPVYFVLPHFNETTGEFVRILTGNVYTVNPITENPFLTMSKLLRAIKQSGAKNILFVTFSLGYQQVMDRVTFPHAVVFHANSENLSLAKSNSGINRCSLVICDSPSFGESLQNNRDILPGIFVLKDISRASCDELVEKLSLLEIKVPTGQTSKKKVLVAYSRGSCHVNTIREHLDAFGLFSKNEITYVDATNKSYISTDYLESFDSVIIHYSVRVSDPGHLSAYFYNGLKHYPGLKILFVQDDYDNVKSTHKYVSELGIDILYSVINEEHCFKLYPKEKFPYLRLIYNLTGYIPYKLEGFPRLPFPNKTTDVFYRGRDLPYQYGTLGMEKYEIGDKFKEASIKTGCTLNLDIDSTEAGRIYGDAWYKSLSQAKTMLGTESGSNVFDMEGDLKQLIEEDKREGLTYDQIYEKRLKQSEEQWHVNMISPKVFEAMVVGTVPILYEGGYSGVITAGRHYVSLKKDFSNINEVLTIISDEKHLQKIAATAIEEIVNNPHFSYPHFIRNKVDTVIDEEVVITMPLSIVPQGNYFLLRKSHKKNWQEMKFHDAYIPSTSLSTDAEMVFDKQIQNRSYKKRSWELIGRAVRKIKRIVKG